MIRINALKRTYSASVLKKKKEQSTISPQKYTAGKKKKITVKFAQLEGLGKCLRPFTDHPFKKERMFEAEFNEFIVIRQKFSSVQFSSVQFSH